MKFMELDIQRFATFSFTVTFNSNTGTGTMNDQLGTNRDDVLNTNTFTKEGYIFNGWNTSADGTGISIQEGLTLGEVSDLTAEVRVNEGITIYAQWTEDNSNKYVTFGGLKRYDEKIKDYIDDTVSSISTYKVGMLSDYITTSGVDNADYAIDTTKIITDNFSGKLYRGDVSGTVAVFGQAYYALDCDFIEVFCFDIGSGEHRIIIYNGYVHKYDLRYDSSNEVDLNHSDHRALSNYKPSGTPEPW